MRRLASALAALLAVVPSWLAAKDSAVEDAQINAKMVLVTARLVHSQTGSFDGMTVPAVKAKHPDLTVVADGPSANPETVGIKAMGHFRIVAYASGYCWGIREPTPAERVPTLYAKRKSEPKDCKASSFSDGDFKEHSHIWAR